MVCLAMVLAGVVSVVGVVVAGGGVDVVVVAWEGAAVVDLELLEERPSSFLNAFIASESEAIVQLGAVKMQGRASLSFFESGARHGCE